MSAQSSSLVAAYSFDQGSGGSAPDATGKGHTGSISGATWTTSGKFGGALQFDGSNDWVTIADASDLDLTTGMTIEAWVKPTTLSGWRTAIMKERSGGFAYALYAHDDDPRPAGYINVGGADHSAVGRAAIGIGTWTHLAATYDGSRLRLYVNGAAVASESVGGSILSSSGPLRIGGNSVWGSEFFAGAIDEVRVYNRAQTASEIQSDMNTRVGTSTPTPTPTPTPSPTPAPAPAPAPSPTPAPATPPVRSNGQPTGTLSAGTTQATMSLTSNQAATCRYSTTSGTGYSGMGGTFTTTGGTSHSTRMNSLTNGSRYAYYVRCQGPTGAVNTDDYQIAFSVATPPVSTSAQGLVAAYSFDQGSGGSAPDATGKGHTGSISGATWTTSGKFGGALQLDGSNDWVTIADASDLDLTTGMTIEAWVKPTTLSGWRTAIMKERSGGFGYALYAHDDDPRPAGYINVGGTDRSAVGRAAIGIGTWTHLAATYDESGLRLYVNGAAVASESVGGSILSSSGPLRIGGNSVWGSEFFAGAIDEVRIYNVARTAAEIQADMNLPVGTGITPLPLPVPTPAPTPTADTTPPTAAITAPTAGTYILGTVTITATASDAVGVTSVTFLVDGAVIGTDSTSPYSVSWNSTAVTAGLHALRAEARDAAGNIGTSAAVTVTVGQNQAPTVTMTSPVNGTTYEAPATITLAANATDLNGSVARVDFYEGTTWLGSDTTSPFSMLWTLNTVGTYAFSANAVDNQGAVTTSASVRVSVTAPVRSGTAIFTASANDSTVTRYVLDVFLNGADPAVSVPVATRDLGKPAVVNGDMSADISATLTALPAGTYRATVSAFAGTLSSRSAPSASFVIGLGGGLSASSFSPSSDTTGSALSSTPADQNTQSTTTASAAGSTAPSAIESRELLWVTNSTTSMVTAFDASTGDVLATIPVGLSPAGIAAPRGVDKVYVADEGTDTVSVISKATMSLVRTIELPAPSGRRPHDVSASPDGRFVYVGELGANVVDVIDTATDQVSNRFSTGWPGSKTVAVRPDPSGEILYGINLGTAESASTLVALDAGTGRWLWYLAIEGDPSGLLVESDGRTGIVTRRGDSKVTRIDLERHAVVNVIDLGAGNSVETLQLGADGRLVAALRSTSARVAVVDLAGRGTLRTVALNERATRSALPATQLSYVCIADSSEVVAVDAASGTVVNRFRTAGGGTPCSVAFDAD